MTKENIDIYLNKPGTKVKKYKFKQFKPIRRKLNVPCITITEAGFSFNRFCKPYFQRKPYTLIYLDNNQSAIAIMPIQEQAEDVYKVNSYNKTNPFVPCAGFIRKHLKPYLNKGSFRMIPIWDDKNKMFILDLKGK